MRVAIVGDVHGHRVELTEMLGRLEDARVDRICFLGDLIDRGDDSFGCLRLARTGSFKSRCGQRRRFEVIRGNHEDAYVRAWFGVPKPGETRPCLPTSDSFLKALRADEVHWMSNLPLTLKIEEMNLLLVHGGILPEMRREADLDARVLRCRYLDEKNGRAVPGFTHSSRFWAEEYDGRFGTVLFGHESWEKPKFFDHAIGLDGEGRGKLHAAIFNSDGRNELTVSTLTVDYKVSAWARLAQTQISSGTSQAPTKPTTPTTDRLNQTTLFGDDKLPLW